MIHLTRADLANRHVNRHLILEDGECPFPIEQLEVIGSLWLHVRVIPHIKDALRLRRTEMTFRGYSKGSIIIPPVEWFKGQHGFAVQAILKDVTGEESDRVARGKQAAEKEVVENLSWWKQSCRQEEWIRHGATKYTGQPIS